MVHDADFTQTFLLAQRRDFFEEDQEYGHQRFGKLHCTAPGYHHISKISTPNEYQKFPVHIVVARGLRRSKNKVLGIQSFQGQKCKLSTRKISMIHGLKHISKMLTFDQNNAKHRNGQRPKVNIFKFCFGPQILLILVMKKKCLVSIFDPKMTEF